MDGEERHLTYERALLRIGAACAIVGAVAGVVLGILHGDLPGESAEAALSYVASRPDWQAVHLSTIFSVLLWVGGLLALSSSIEDEMARRSLSAGPIRPGSAGSESQSASECSSVG